VGPTAFNRPAKNALENLRPQHILEALFVPQVDSAGGKNSFEEAEENGRRYYILTVFQAGDGEAMFPLRKIWFDRANLDVARLQTYGPKGNYIEGVDYSGYQDFEGTRYPSLIQITRPVEDYRLGIAIQKAAFNKDIPPDKFELKKPEGAELIDLSAKSQPEVDHGK
jgi:outer membrane lipoprotein-sorting protein